MVLTFYSEHMHDVFLGLHLRFNVRAGNLELPVGVLRETSVGCLARLLLLLLGSLLNSLSLCLGRGEIGELVGKSILKITRRRVPNLVGLAEGRFHVPGRVGVFVKIIKCPILRIRYGTWWLVARNFVGSYSEFEKVRTRS
jgi:hypothetical protein